MAGTRDDKTQDLSEYGEEDLLNDLSQDRERAKSYKEEATKVSLNTLRESGRHQEADAIEEVFTLNADKEIHPLIFYVAELIDETQSEAGSHLVVRDELLEDFASHFEHYYNVEHDVDASSARNALAEIVGALSLRGAKDQALKLARYLAPIIKEREDNQATRHGDNASAYRRHTQRETIGQTKNLNENESSGQRLDELGIPRRL